MQQQQQGDIEAFMRQAMSGDPVALEELMIKSPKAAQMVAQHLQSKVIAEQDEVNRFQGEVANNTANFIEQMHKAPLGQQESMFNAAIEDPRYDIDEEDRNLFMDTNARKAIVGRIKGKDYAESFFGKQIDPAKQAELGIKQAELELSKAESKEKILDRKLARETNKIKKQELQVQIDQAKIDKEKAKNLAKVEAEKEILNVDSTLSVAKELLSHEGLDPAVGGTSFFYTTPGSDAANFESKLTQFKSKQFLTNIKQMKGMGSLSESEGNKIAAAAGALDLNMSEDAFRKEMNIIIPLLEKAKIFTQRKYGVTPEAEEDAIEKDQPELSRRAMRYKR